jgi:hypothetical protein
MAPGSHVTVINARQRIKKMPLAGHSFFAFFIGNLLSPAVKRFKP